MTDTSVSPWQARFLPLLDKDEIRRRALRIAVPVTALDKLPVDAACKVLTDAMEAVFHPTAQIVEILHQLVSRGLGHCHQLYPNMQCFTTNIYQRDAPLPEFVPPICLTGLAGVGKSCLANALEQILPVDGHVHCPPESSEFPMRSLWKIDVRIRSSLKDIFTPLAGAEGSLGDQLKTARKRAYRDGVSLLLADEFQFLTASPSANTRITQTLISLGYVGLPMAYIANYSLLYRLLRRPQEDRDRLLADVIIMSPDSPESDDWTDTLAALIAVAPDIFRINAKIEGPQFHRYCAGIKRAATKLLIGGYRIARMQQPDRGDVVVTMAHIQAAYQSVQFSAHRTDTEIITQQLILGRMVNRRRNDLWCPLGLPPMTNPALSEEMGRRRDIRLTEEIQRAAAAGGEREAVEARNLSTGADNTNSVVKLPRPKRPTAETLKANAASLRGL
jgi:hypothetical protein